LLGVRLCRPRCAALHSGHRQATLQQTQHSLQHWNAGHTTQLSITAKTTTTEPYIDHYYDHYYYDEYYYYYNYNYYYYDYYY
jgi:hypothetical protein